MYDFSKVTKDTSSEGYSLPSEAMKFDGVYLEDEIEGYRTLSVSGRELISYDIIDSEASGRDGRIFLGATLPPRNITVQYSLESDSTSDMRDKFNRMNQLLSTKEAVVSFNDEPDYEFIGTLGRASGVSEGRLNVIGSFDIVCLDPYKYKVADEFTGTGSVTIDLDTFEPTVVDEIIVDYSGSVDTFEIVNENKDLKIRLINASEHSSDIRVLPKEQKIIRNNTERPKILDWTSDLENFVVESGDVITISPSSTNMTIKIRERLR